MESFHFEYGVEIPPDYQNYDIIIPQFTKDKIAYRFCFKENTYLLINEAGDKLFYRVRAGCNYFATDKKLACHMDHVAQTITFIIENNE
ncbi:hypothetical protein [Aerococcus kribbianus]|uniref:Uncharacterized protein n=1 Tax=Aerococcus kribbianus TaxID=2999064 RepID=A0A9X3FSL5_9LACT|nr:MULTISPECIES: hypothetical protein [unclassified Aerococcus]MCZ0717632.1 hypothetical protein [Aerococcus sp. YH-aer221]MCZ0725920.1 hypothetical protein [Aerococcus sp. YH-aer222]